MIYQIVIISSIITFSMTMGSSASWSSITKSTFNLGCTSPNQLQWKYTSQTPVTFQRSTYFYDSATGGSVRLQLARDNSASNFKWIYKSQASSTATIIQVADTIDSSLNQYKFASMFGKILILQTRVDNGVYGKYSEYIVYIFDSSKTSISGQTSSYLRYASNVNIFHSNDAQNYIVIGYYSNGVAFVSKCVFQAGKIKSITPQSYVNFPVKNFVGNQDFIFDDSSSLFKYYVKVDSNFEWKQFSTYSTVDLTLDKLKGKLGSTQLVMSYPFRLNKITVLSITASDKLTGNLYVLDNSAKFITKINCQPSVAVGYADYSDNVQNFIRIGSVQIHWVTLLSDKSDWINSNILTSDISIKDLRSVALTKNKAVFLYIDKMVYYSHEDTDSVKLIFSNTFTQDNKVGIDSTKQYISTIKCYCPAINKFTCFAATLNCVILIKAKQQCSS